MKERTCGICHHFDKGLNRCFKKDTQVYHHSMACKDDFQEMKISIETKIADSLKNTKTVTNTAMDKKDEIIKELTAEIRKLKEEYAALKRSHSGLQGNMAKNKKAKETMMEEKMAALKELDKIKKEKHELMLKVESLSSEKK